MSELEVHGITIEADTRLTTDHAAMRSLYEAGVSSTDLAKQFKINASSVRLAARRGGWLAPSKINRMRKEIERKQSDIYRKSGKTLDVNAIKAEIWQDRAEGLKEKTYEIVKSALDGVSPEKAKKMIQNPLGLFHITNVARTITGEEKAEADNVKVAVNIGFLRSAAPEDIAPAVDV